MTDFNTRVYVLVYRNYVHGSVSVADPGFSWGMSTPKVCVLNYYIAIFC